MINAAKKNGADLVVSDFIRVSDEEKLIEEEHSFPALSTDDKNEMFDYLNSNWRIRPAWNKLYKKEIFNDTTKLEFEGKWYSAPIGYKEFLKTRYGDYMKLPKKEDRITHMPINIKLEDAYFGTEKKISLRTVNR